jgi:hypothetical protein
MTPQILTKPYILLTESANYGTHYLKATFVYLSTEDGKPRNYSWDFGRAEPTHPLRLDSLGLQGHFYEPSTTTDLGTWTSHDIGYYESYRVELADAKSMVKTLEALAKRMTKLSETVGPCKDFGDVVVRLGAAVGVAGYLIYRKDTHRSSYCGSDFITMTAGDILYHIARRTHALNEEHGRIPQAVAA